MRLEFPVRMKHDYNGFTHANDHNELERNKRNGWEIEEQAKVKAAPVVEPEEAEKKKPGRPKAK